MRSVGVRVLARLGYSVLEAADARQALELREERRGDVHLVLTDLIMPGMSGRELARQVRARYPDVKVLFASGYSDDSVVRDGLLKDLSDFLAKPYLVAELGRKVRQVLRSDEARGVRSDAQWG